MDLMNLTGGMRKAMPCAGSGLLPAAAAAARPRLGTRLFALHLLEETFAAHRKQV